MDFIEKIVGLMGGKAAQTDSSATDAPGPESVTPPQDTPTADEGSGETEQPQEPKTYTPGELESILADKKKEWQDEQEAREQERLSKLPELERLRQEQLSNSDKIASLKAELARRDLQAEVIAKLDERRLPVSIADLVQYGDRDSTMESLDKLMGVFDTAVQEGVMLRLRGKTPEGLGAAAWRQNSLVDPDARGLNGKADPFAKAFSDALKK
ncbi:DUF4355 domain-containing protein [uncultured Oscillibacter sp.]|uniref:DUF4355 domain-containing protein n=1 Tax=uncultured Oscillibacter sp. TaxID=876091 RepID=UPI0026310333|nr:DUF4355 domain-containing protein [uncultured Oscillibacter sp.]